VIGDDPQPKNAWESEDRHGMHVCSVPGGVQYYLPSILQYREYLNLNFNTVVIERRGFIRGIIHFQIK